MNPAVISDQIQAKVRSFTQRPRELTIGGRWQSARSGSAFDVVDPATGKVFAQAAAGDSEDIDAGVSSTTPFETGRSGRGQRRGTGPARNS